MIDGSIVPMGRSGIVFAPSRILNAASYASGGAGMAGTATDYLSFLEALRTGDKRLLRAETLNALQDNQLGGANNSELLGPGVGFGFVSAVVVDPKLANSPAHAGTLRWGGVYGHSWFIDPQAQISMVLLTNTALEGMSGKLPQDIQRAIYDTAASTN
jgi:CubicO group peptidase (beta-lactamase class C family)